MVRGGKRTKTAVAVVSTAARWEAWKEIGGRSGICCLRVPRSDSCRSVGRSQVFFFFFCDAVGLPSFLPVNSGGETNIAVSFAVLSALSPAMSGPCQVEALFPSIPYVCVVSSLLKRFLFLFFCGLFRHSMALVPWPSVSSVRLSCVVVVDANDTAAGPRLHRQRHHGCTIPAPFQHTTADAEGAIHRSQSQPLSPRTRCRTPTTGTSSSRRRWSSQKTTRTCASPSGNA